MPPVVPGGSPPGWGAESWGSGGYGGPVGAGFSLLSALAIAENVVQLVFSEPVYFSGLLDTPDASVISHYIVAADASTVGYDGNPARDAFAMFVEPSNVDIPSGVAFGAALDIILDRPMSPYPTRYSINVSGIYSADLSQLLTPTVLTFYGLYRELVRPSVDVPTLSRDFANPSSLASTVGLANAQNLGVFNYDDSGDYAIDQGLVSYKKRVYRRLITRPGGFLHLGNGYGVGVPQQAKKLARSATIQNLAVQAENQIGQEPETQACSVKSTMDPNGLLRLSILAKVKGGRSVKYSAGFPTS